MMPLTKMFRGDKRVREGLGKIIRGEFSHYLKRGDEAGYEFMLEDDLNKVWSSARLQMLSKGLDWADVESQNRALEDFKKVLSILVYIHWDEWEKFRDIFLDHVDKNGRPDRTDEDLPFLFNDDFLTPAQRREFLKVQYIFIPVVLAEESAYEDTEAEYNKLHRMPFLQSEVIGEGATGIVTKELIAARHFRRGETLNPTPFWVASKSIERERGSLTGKNNTSFATERKALRAFKQCLEHHGNIMHSYTTFTHGSHFAIISPLADLDLREFLEGDYPDFADRQRHFTPLDLLREAACLASALDYLHRGLKLRDKRIACAHLDFKPDNILVQWSADGRMPVGQWLVHDFGTSRIKEPSDIAGLAPGDFLAQFSLTKAQRTPGPFQAPEVQQSQEKVVGRESDMWSFGCLLAVVIAFAIGGPRYVEDLGKSRDNRFQPDQAATDYFYAFDRGKPIVKPTIVGFLSSLKTEAQEDAWIGRTLDLVFKMLVDAPVERLSAHDAEQQLYNITDQEGTFLQKNCNWITPATSSQLRRKLALREHAGLQHVGPEQRPRASAMNVPIIARWSNITLDLDNSANPTQSSRTQDPHSAYPYSPQQYTAYRYPPQQNTGLPSQPNSREYRPHQSQTHNSAMDTQRQYFGSPPPQNPQNPQNYGSRPPQMKKSAPEPPREYMKQSPPQNTNEYRPPANTQHPAPRRRKTNERGEASTSGLGITTTTNHESRRHNKNIGSTGRKNNQPNPLLQPFEAYGHMGSQNSANSTSTSAAYARPAKNSHLPQTPPSNLSRNPSLTPSMVPSIIRRTTVENEVISSPTNYPATPEHTNRSDENSSLGSGSFLSPDISFLYLTAPQRALKSIICSNSRRIASLSERLVLVPSFVSQNNWVQKRPSKPPDRITLGFEAPWNIQCPSGFVWDMMSLREDYIVLRASSPAQSKFFRYRCHTVFDRVHHKFWDEEPFSISLDGTPAPSAINTRAKYFIDVIVNRYGDTIFVYDEGVCYYSRNFGLHTLTTEGQMMKASFSSDGNYVFAWTLIVGPSNHQNHGWYIWQAFDSVQIMHTKTSRMASTRPGHGSNALIFPFDRGFAAFEIPNRLYFVALDAHQSQVVQLIKPVEDVIAGVGYENSETQSQALIVVKGGSSPRLSYISLLPEIEASEPSPSQELEGSFKADSDDIAVVAEEPSPFVIISHANGLVERRKITA